MKTAKRKLVGAIALFAGTLVASSANAMDRELLDVLLSNGAITQAQHDELSQKAQKDEKKTDELLKNMAWAGKLKIKGDLRVRQEWVDDSGGAGDNRQRYRARLGVYAKVNDNLKAGVRVASGSSATSTNETLGDGFKNDTVYFDLAYLDWEVIDGLELIGGKFKKPWQKVSGGLLWDGDVNPEGAAARYTAKMSNGKLALVIGHLVLDDVEDLTFSEDQRVDFGQGAYKFKSGDVKGKFGIGYFKYDANDKTGALITGGGNDSSKYGLFETFAEVGFKASVPLNVYGHYIKNLDADGPHGNEDTAWLIGVSTKFDKFKLGVDYRDTELNAVNGAFNDSDFAGGRTDSSGWKVGLGYKIDKHFSFGGTYINSETGNLNGNRDIDIVQLDLKAKF